ncbi:MAG TPA: sigma-70 family RNA polymerase sigma factor [Fimbriimonas sp.]|nr:sigma-70 family RNA polymerase sigma factor [Fimbriimonas sp.]
MKEGQIPDALLIERFQRGDNRALDTLIERHQARAYQYAYRLCRDRDTAADVVADAYVRVYRAAHTFKGQSAFTTWLYRILTNCFLDMRKKASSRPSVSLETTLQTEDGGMDRQFESDDLSPHDEAERSERERSIQAAVELLPEYQKVMITMFHVEMLSYEEIAQILDLPIGTVKSRLNRARLGLRMALEPEKELFTASAEQQYAYVA